MSRYLKIALALVSLSAAFLAGVWIKAPLEKVSALGETINRMVGSGAQAQEGSAEEAVGIGNLPALSQELHKVGVN